jgi:hypothetical protein
MNYQRLYESSMDIDKFKRALKNSWAIEEDIKVHGFEEIGPDTPVISKGPIHVKCSKSAFMLYNDCLTVSIDFGKIISLVEEAPGLWELQLNNGQEFSIDLRPKKSLL